ncbi:MAG: rRNA maturation RNase YbeY [Flavobacteriales bacterium]
MPLTPDHDPAESGVHFHADHPSFAFENIAARSAWIERCIDHHDCELGRINIVAVTDETLHAINIEFLDHDTLTDIITFDDVHDKLIGGELYISWDRVLDNAVLFDLDEEDELDRVIIHGVLHLLGFKDKTEEDAALMRSKEDEWLALRSA